MAFKIITEDPLNILSSTKHIVENGQYVFLNLDKIENIAEKVAQRIEQGFETAEEIFGNSGNFQNNVQLIFIEDVVNFCFWAEKNKEKWQVEWQGKVVNGGWYALKMCFERALTDKIPILDAKYLASITKRDAEKFFQSSNNTSIPLINERLKNLVEAGKILLEKYQGLFINALEEAGYDAIKLVQLIYDNFPSFRDVVTFKNNELFFLKRAQIVASDISYLCGKKLQNVEKLTAFADYKLPQVLRMFEVMEYTQRLADKIDKMTLIPAGSQEEIEIRATTIWVVELIRQHLKKYTASQIDNALWLMSQTIQDQTKPYHRTYSTFY